MKFGLLHFRVFQTDGVSLEMDKWRIALERLGHEVVYISGSDLKRDDHLYCKSLFYRSEYNTIIHDNAFTELSDFNSKKELLDHINDKAVTVENELTDIIVNNNIDVLVPNNVSSLAYNLPVGIAVGEINRKELCQFLYHHHDFHWERDRYQNPLFTEIDDIIKEYFPFKGAGQHCTINNIAKDELFKRKGIIAKVVPNVFDFHQPLWVSDDYNNDLREVVGIKESDIVFLQATRLAKRKAIEYAYSIVNAFAKDLTSKVGKTLYNGYEITKQTKVHFVLAGLNEMTEIEFKELNTFMRNENVEIHYINDIVEHSRSNNGKKSYSLWDVYTMADFITYTSVLEGWGNQLLEALFAKKPAIVYEYPVFKSDIKSYNLDLVTFFEDLKYQKGSGLLEISSETVDEIVQEINGIIFDNRKYNQSVEANFENSKTNLSYETLYNIIKGLIVVN